MLSLSISSWNSIANSIWMLSTIDEMVSPSDATYLIIEFCSLSNSFSLLWVFDISSMKLDFSLFLLMRSSSKSLWTFSTYSPCLSIFSSKWILNLPSRIWISYSLVSFDYLSSTFISSTNVSILTTPSEALTIMFEVSSSKSSRPYSIYEHSCALMSVAPLSPAISDTLLFSLIFFCFLLVLLVTNSFYSL